MSVIHSTLLHTARLLLILEAAGHGIPKNYDAEGNLIPATAQQLEEYRLMVKQTTLNILGMRFVFGFFCTSISTNSVEI